MEENKIITEVDNIRKLVNNKNNKQHNEAFISRGRKKEETEDKNLRNGNEKCGYN